MDRNTSKRLPSSRGIVALRKESVDRNSVLIIAEIQKLVALRKESVDRNVSLTGLVRVDTRSLSARRAWIETPAHKTFYRERAVALRKESVDRN